MAETDILNPQPGWDENINDDPCPDYGFTRKRPNTRVGAKPPGGQPFTRETSNSGYTFQLSWLDRSYKCAQRMKQFAEQYEDGFFTIIDQDGGGRHYVGRFTGECNVVQHSNDSYNMQDWTFEEVPGAPMLNYPSDWDRDSIAMSPWNDFGQPLASLTGTWTSNLTYGVKTLDNTGDPTAFATMEYRGYGFQLWMLQGPTYGQVEVSLDGVVLSTVNLNSATQDGSTMVFAKADVSTDLHRVKLRTISGLVSWVKLQVMR